MKKLLIGCTMSMAVISLVSCHNKSHNGIYVASWKNEFTMADDTIIIKDNIVTKRTGFRKIRNGQVKPKEWGIDRWVFNAPYGPIIEVGDQQISIGNTVYKQIN
ncbi:hypothetical protein IDJ77_03975 [Mucilaginibacter sp. ZT4R22]|uniref:Uncharacterized protein n=1 Tax=Mucilaginibacter pankratovii TaxID=2772110 RepID=A0ABR7WNL4_9SPHI|nr:hypothetical protein [Mucilaginibacter pankratovii]MBD1362959.1 hypothetical protein [Mucilaginibacter pankratovii]